MHLHKEKHLVYMAWDDDLCKALKSESIEVLPSLNLLHLRENERQHADMQLCIIKNKAFIPECCRSIENKLTECGYDVVVCSSLSKVYPHNVSLNIALIGNRLFCKSSALDNKIMDYTKTENLDIINVNQGYTKCSTLILNDNAIITADPTIYDTALKQGIEALRISSGDIQLEGAEYGFIGGCSGVINDTVYFFGDISKHKDSLEIINFLANHNMKYVCLGDSELKDIGGFVLLR